MTSADFLSLRANSTLWDAANCSLDSNKILFPQTSNSLVFFIYPFCNEASEYFLYSFGKELILPKQKATDARVRLQEPSSDGFGFISQLTSRSTEMLSRMEEQLQGGFQSQPGGLC